jgi:NitT/TauT family transport system substrate-binding protein
MSSGMIGTIKRRSMILSKPSNKTWTAALLMVLTANSAYTQSATDKHMQPLTVRLSWTPGGYDAPFFLAAEKSWFANRGLDVTVLDGNGSSVTVQTVGAGQFDVGYTNLAVMAIGRDKGLRVRAIADILRKSDLGVVFPADSAIKNVQDLKGKSIAYTPASFETPFLPYFFKTAGLSESEVTLVAVDAAAKYTTYASGKTDAVITSAPYFIPLLANTRPSQYILFSDVGLTLPGFGLIATEDTIKRKPAALRAIVEVLAEAWKYILDGHEAEAVQSIVKQRPQARLNPNMLLAVINIYKSFFETPATRGKPIGWQADTDWIEGLRVMREAGIITSKAPSFDYYTNDFVSPH